MESITEVIQNGIRPLLTIHIFGKSISFSNIFFAMILASFLFFLLVFFLSHHLKWCSYWQKLLNWRWGNRHREQGNS